MSLNLYPNIYASGSVPAGWKPIRGSTIKYSVNNAKLLNHLRSLRLGRWQKVVKGGTSGDVHYFEHASGQVAGVKFFEN